MSNGNDRGLCSRANSCTSDVNVGRIDRLNGRRGYTSIKSNQIASNQIKLNRITSNQIELYHIKSYQIISNHLISQHILTSYHFISKSQSLATGSMATDNVEPKAKDTMYEAVEELYVRKRWKRWMTVKDCTDEIA